MFDYKLYKERQIECAKELRKKLMSMEKSLSKFASKMYMYAPEIMDENNEVGMVLDGCLDNLCYRVAYLEDMMDKLRGRQSCWGKRNIRHSSADDVISADDIIDDFLSDERSR